MLKNKFVAQVRNWLKTGKKNARVHLNLDTPLFDYRGELRAYFSLTVDKEVYSFYIGREGEEFNQEFGGDTSDNCYSMKQCTWYNSMMMFLSETEDFSVKTVLDQVILLALGLDRTPDEDMIEPPNRFNPKSDIEELFVLTRSKPHGMIIFPSSMNTWKVRINKVGQLRDVVLDVTIKSNKLGYYGAVKVVAPRLEITGDVDFGGIVTYKGLNETSPVRNRKEVVSCINDFLNEQVPYILSDIPYNHKEASVCLEKQTRVSDNKTPIQIVRDNTLNDDEVSVSYDWFDKNLKTNASYMFLEVTSDLGLSGCYVVVPKNRKAGTIGLSNLSFINLNINKDQCNGSMSLYSPVFPVHLVVRPRVNKDTTYFNLSKDEFLQVLSLYKTLSAGHTYSIKNKYNVYVDILEVLPHKYCNMVDTDFKGLDISVDVNLDLYRQKDPLEVIYDTDTEESESDSD